MAGRKPYPDEFRVLLVEQVEAGSSRRAAGQRLRVSAATAVRWAQHKARTGGRTADLRSAGPARRWRPRRSGCWNW